jgi:hypothetical protein
MEQGLFFNRIDMYTTGVPVSSGIYFIPVCHMIAAKSFLAFFEDTLVGAQLTFDSLGGKNTPLGFFAVFSGPAGWRGHICVHILKVFCKASKRVDSRCNYSCGSKGHAKELPLA